MRVFVVATIMLGLSVPVLAGQSQQALDSSPSVKSAQITVLPASDKEITVAIKNSGQRVLEAWQFAGHYLDDSGRTRSFETRIDNYPWTTYLSGTKPPDDQGPIGPGEQKLQVVSTAGFKSLVDVRLVFVLFDDQSREGDPTELGFLFKQRENDAADTEAVLTTLREAIKLPPGQAKAFLRPRVAEAGEGRPVLKANKRMIAALESAPDAEFAKRASDLVTYLEQKRAAALRHQKNR